MGPLEDVRVVDFGHHVAGPVLGMHLADLGAHVVKVERPSGPPETELPAAIWNCGKERRVVDLGTSDGQGEARALALDSDVVLENFRPGVADRLGIGGSALRSAKPDLIHVALPAFGRHDPRAAMPGWECTVLAALDVFRPVISYGDVVPLLHEPPTVRRGEPVFTAEPMASMFAAVVAGVAVAAALRVRDRTGEGQAIEVPLFDAMLQGIGIFGMTKLPFRPLTRPAFGPWDDGYSCADGRVLQIVCTMPRHAEAAARALGRPDFIERGMCGRGITDREPELSAELADFLTTILGTRTASDWEAFFHELGLPAAMVRTPEEWFEHPQATAGGLVTTIDTAAGPVEGPGAIVTVRSVEVGESPEPHRTAPPTVDDPPLAGIRVLDLTVILAGPTAGRTLGEFGADVIKIDPPVKTVLYHRDINRAKRHLRLDLGSRAGRKLFFRLLDTADVVVQNFRPGVMARLGLSEAELFAKRPDLVYVTMNAYGDEGPWSGQPGYEETAEAITGMQARFGGANSPAMWPFGVVNDYGTGFAAAMGTIAALRDRDRTGRGQVVHASLARTATVLQSAHLYRHNGEVAAMVGGLHCRGADDRQRLLRCADGWVAFGAGPQVELPVDLEPRARVRASAEMVTELLEVGAGAHSLVWLNDVLDEPEIVDRGLAEVREHDDGRSYRAIGPGRWLARSPVVIGRPAPTPGSDAESILAEIGRGGDLSGLAKRGVLEIPGFGG